MRDHEHAGVHLVALGIPRLEVAPVPRRAKERLRFLGRRTGGQSISRALVLLVQGGRKHPLGHLAIRPVRNVDFAQGQRGVDRAGQCGRLEPVSVGHDHVAEPLEPAIFINMVISFRPGAELLAVVGEDDGGARPPLGQAAEKLVGGVGFLEGDRVPQGFGTGKDLEQGAFLFGEVVTKEIVAGYSRALEVEVVEDGVFNARLGDRRDEVLLPDPLGNPHAADLGWKELFEIGRVIANLPHPVAVGNHGHDRLLVALRPGSQPGLFRPGRELARCIQACARPAIPGAGRRCAGRRGSRDSLPGLRETADSCLDRRIRTRRRNCQRVDDCARRKSNVIIFLLT